MKIFTQKKVTAALSFLLLVLPLISRGAGIVPDCGADCGFRDLMQLANNIIHFLFYDVAIPLTVLVFVYSGGKLVLNQDKEGAWKEAKGSFENIGWGFAYMLGSYVLIKTVIYFFLNTDAGFYTFLVQ